ncbi:hypothetical protein [Oecophyllibacter saccharovorans]|uniref:hypothetical protein n=1 Tax=Oecophyllibacter saccharovorans TaxID=2558360 RepID=UPI00114386C4|nr:hypothetical protein [Oecophyllibacter saccharovorans]
MPAESPRPARKPATRKTTARKAAAPGAGAETETSRALQEATHYAQQHWKEALDVKLAIMRDPEARPLERRGAAEAILNRAFGKPKTVETLAGSDSTVDAQGPFRIIVQHLSRGE